MPTRTSSKASIAPARQPAARSSAERSAARASSPSPLGVPGLEPVMRIARELRSWTDTVLGMAGGAANMSMAFAESTVKDPKAKAAIAKAGAMLRRAREAAGVTTQQLGAAIDLSDPALLERAESGKAALPFEVVLRLAAVLGRNDPLTFALKLTRSYSPEMWKALEDLGVGRLVVQAGRERELANLYRANDAARKLSDEDFAQVLRFTGAAFEMAVAFRSGASTARKDEAARD